MCDMCTGSRGLKFPKSMNAGGTRGTNSAQYMMLQTLHFQLEM